MYKFTNKKFLANKFPDKPGVYLMKDVFNNIIYVGKASSLKKRIQSYFNNSSKYNLKTAVMVQHIKNIEYIITKSDVEALILESSLIKKHKPKYNVMWKDDKSYPLIKLTLNERYPRLLLTRTILQDNAQYFGPYVIGSAKKMLKTIYGIYPIRDCTLNMNKTYKRACIKEQIKKCSAPCTRKISHKKYMEIVEKVKQFLEGKQQILAVKLKKRMLEASKKMEYEDAAKYRDMYEMVSLLIKHSENKTEFSKVSREERKEEFTKKILQKLKEVFNMKKLPKVIEAFDVSNFIGKEPTASLVVFENGKPNKKKYRHFNIKSVKTIDDYAMMKEVIRRRYKKLKAPYPDLILIDGGKGHLSAVLNTLKELTLHNLHVAALAKKQEELFVKWSNAPIKLSKTSPILHLFQRIRDEAHRFAIKHHRNKLKKTMIESQLKKIRGIGNKTANKLLSYFKDISLVKKAGIEELLKAGLNKSTAQCLKKYIKE